MLRHYTVVDETWIICGGRGFGDQALFDQTMQDLFDQFGCPERIVQGGATGADAMAGAFARKLGIKEEIVKPDWHLWGPVAGNKRNQKMLDDFNPDMVLAFPGGKGTKDMITRAELARDTGKIPGLRVAVVKWKYDA